MIEASLDYRLTLKITFLQEGEGAAMFSTENLKRYSFIKIEMVRKDTITSPLFSLFSMKRAVTKYTNV